MHSLALIALLSPLASAGSTPLQAPPSTPAPIVGGSDVAACGWPATAHVGCSATLIHPQIMISANHCGEPSEIKFGEDKNDPVRTVSIDRCVSAAKPPFDFRYCVLSEPVNVPIVPPLMGCELAQTRAGDEVTLVGFGRTTPGPSGAPGGSSLKQQLTDQILGFGEAKRAIAVGPTDGEAGACYGDSGGSTYVKVADGTFRASGVASSINGSECPAVSNHVVATEHLRDIEIDTGFDVTPCYDDEGNWAPTDKCAAVADPAAGAGTWANDCSGAPLVPLSTCGPSFEEDPDTEGPVVDFGELGENPHAAPYEATLTVEIEDASAIRSASLTLADQSGGTLFGPPWAFGTANIPAGEYELVIEAEDWSGNSSRSAVTIVVESPGADGGADDGAEAGEGGEGDEGDEGGGNDSSDGGGAEGGSESGATATETADDGADDGNTGSASDSGGGCRSAELPMPLVSWLMLTPLWIRRRGTAHSA